MDRIWLKNYPKGVPQDIDPNQYQSIADLINESCREFSSNTAYINFGAKLSFAELDQKSTDFAAFLQSKGLKKGDRIALQMPNLLQYPVALFGSIKAGLIVVNTNPLYTESEMLHQFIDSGAKAIVILTHFADKLEKILPKTSISLVITTNVSDLLPRPKSYIIHFVLKYIKKAIPKFHLNDAISMNDALAFGRTKKFEKITLTPSDIAFLQYTGGTTGVSKGAILTHKNVIANMLMIYEWMKSGLDIGKETVVTALPLYHIFSLTVNCLSFSKLGGCNLLITNPKDIPGFAKILSKNHFTVFTGVNTLFNALNNNKLFNSIDFSSLKVSVAGGMALQEKVAKEWKIITGSPIAEGFGLTETSPVVSCNPIDGNEKVGTIGLPLPSTHIKIIDDEGKEIITIGDRGELCVKGPQVMAGYWNQPEETKNVLTDDSWLKTGDIAVIDDQGFLKIVDRKKDMILVSGFNVFPNEVEDALIKHPDILEIAAIGVPDEKSGESVKVFVVPKNPDLKKESVLEFAKNELVAYKRPKSVEFRTELPKTNVGKVLRRALKE